METLYNVLIDRNCPFIILQNNKIVYASQDFKKHSVLLLNSKLFTDIDWGVLFRNDHIEEFSFDSDVPENGTVLKEFKAKNGENIIAITRKIFWDQCLAFIIFFSRM